ncbi:MAG: hypothetical protein QOI63_1881 [Thermoplasmata archaeon]|jgi:outer membrane protein assembly factor BamB|nr:hypothetical protein [Thermoplasmata archaeon]
MSRLLAVAALAVLLAGCSGSASSALRFLPDPGADVGGARWAPKLVAALGDPATSGLAGWPRQFDAPAKAYDIDGDGVDELVAQANDTFVYVFRAYTGEVLAKLPTSYPPAWHIERVLNPVEAAVLRPGEAPSLVVTDHAAYVAVWRYDAGHSTKGHFAFTKQFDRRMDECHRSPGMDAKATIADVGDGGPKEILVQTEEVGFYALRADGTTLWKQCWGGGNSAPVVDDLDGDGRLEAIVASDAGFISVLDAKTGVPRWTYDSRKAGVTPASVSVSPTVADLDGQGQKEILYTARNAPKGGPETFASDHLAIFAIHEAPGGGTGELVWEREPAWANPLSYTTLLVRDVDGDGRPDLFGMDWNTIGHYPGNWERLGAAHAFRLDAQGNDVWVREVDAWWSNKDIALGDLDGSGKLSLLVNGPGGGYDGFWRLSAATGSAQAFLPLADWKVARGAQLLDLRHDGGVQLVFPVEPVDGGIARGAILVFQVR